MTEVGELADTRRITFLCAEAVPWRCHRQLLADAFLAREWESVTSWITVVTSTSCRRSLNWKETKFIIEVNSRRGKKYSGPHQIWPSSAIASSVRVSESFAAYR